jgi:hypothetical protein
VIIVTASNTENLCQNCGRPLSRSEVYCGNCGKQVGTGTDKTTTPFQHNTPFPPTQPYPRPPITPTYPVAPKQPFWTRRKIIVLSVLLFLFIGTFAYQLGRNNLPGSTPQPTATTASGSTPQSTATTASETITRNLDIPCINCNSFKLDIKLTTIVIDTTQQKSTWNFTLTNNGYPFSSIYFTTLVLEDNNGQKHQGGGPASTDRWNMSSGESIPTYTTFDVVHGTNFLLSIVADYGTYQTVPISF